MTLRWAGARWVLAATAVGIFGTTRLSLYTLPSEEILYDTRVLFLMCNERSCTSQHTLEIGNTGRAAIQQVIVRLDEEMVSKAILPPRVSTFGKVPRSVKIARKDGVRAYALGKIEPGERVEVHVTYQATTRDEIPSWDEVLVSIEGGSVTPKRGHPAAVTFGRWMVRLFGW